MDGSPTRPTTSGRMRLTKAQQRALLKLYRQERDNHRSFLAFRRGVGPLAFEPEVATIFWCGMCIGIEPDGYAHS